MPARRMPPLASLLLASALAGCQQAPFNPAGDLGPCADPGRGPLAMAAAGAGAAEKAAEPAGTVSTVACPEAPRRPISLAECVALALENGRTGEFFDRADSERRTSVTGLQQQAPASSASDSVRVFAYDPAVAGTEVTQALSRFDVLWRTGFDWTKETTPAGLPPANVPLVGLLNGEQETGNFHSELLKPLPTGGVAGITFRTDYAKAFVPPGAGVLNPAYLPGVEFSFEQPLLQGGGVLVNELRQTFPPSLLHPLPSGAVPPEGAARPGILLARIARKQTELEFERRVQQVLFAVEDAYWGLYGAYWDLYSRDSGMRQAQLAWQVAKQRFQAGGIDAGDLAQIEEQYHAFRSQRLEALGNGSGGRLGVLEAERRLRYVVGLPPEDGTRLVPCDAPAGAPVEPNWEAAVQDARQRRPELIQVREEIRTANLALVRARDFLLPDLRFVSKYGVNGLASTLGASFRNLGEDPFGNWELGLQMQVPLGFRAGQAEVARAKLLLAQRYAFLRDQEAKVLLSLQRSYRDVVQYREEVATRRAQREAAALQVRARYERFRLGKETPDLLLRAQRGWADALRDEQAAVCKYNVALADLERQKGTILDYHNVKLVEGPLPPGAEPHASEEIRRRCAAAAPPAAGVAGPGGGAAAADGSRVPRLPGPGASELRKPFEDAESVPQPPTAAAGAVGGRGPAPPPGTGPSATEVANLSRP